MKREIRLSVRAPYKQIPVPLPNSNMPATGVKPNIYPTINLY
jgi:hypothetical protein